jgi:hypothetical protein
MCLLFIIIPKVREGGGGGKGKEGRRKGLET